MEFQEIEQKALEILDWGAGANSIPVDPYSIAKRAGLKVKWIDTRKITFKEGKEIPPSSIHGIYDRQSSQILIASFLPRLRKNFTVAHELGHHFLHEDLHFRLDRSNFDIQEESKEKEANHFAACLLMPKEAVINSWKINKSNVKLMAIDYDVSEIAMLNRLKLLSLKS